MVDIDFETWVTSNFSGAISKPNNESLSAGHDWLTEELSQSTSFFNVRTNCDFAHLPGTCLECLPAHVPDICDDQLVERFLLSQTRTDSEVPSVSSRLTSEEPSTRISVSGAENNSVSLCPSPPHTPPNSRSVSPCSGESIDDDIWSDPLLRELTFDYDDILDAGCMDAHVAGSDERFPGMDMLDMEDVTRHISESSFVNLWTPIASKESRNDIHVAQSNDASRYTYSSHVNEYSPRQSQLYQSDCLLSIKDKSKILVTRGLFPNTPAFHSHESSRVCHYFVMKDGRGLSFDSESSSEVAGSCYDFDEKAEPVEISRVNIKDLSDAQKESLKAILRENIEKQEKALLKLLLGHINPTKMEDIEKRSLSPVSPENKVIEDSTFGAPDEENALLHRQPTRRRRHHKFRQRPNKCYHLWDFMRELLDRKVFDGDHCVEWVCKANLEFRITSTKVLSELWGCVKKSKSMTYEKLSRTIRYYCKLNILEKINGKRLQFRFGEGKMWKKVQPLKHMEKRAKC